MLYTDQQLIDTIAENLNAYQDILIERVRLGRTQDQEIEPTLLLSFSELKQLTGRSRGRQAFFETIVDGLIKQGLEAVYIDGEGISVTKRAERLEIEFDSLKKLLKNVNLTKSKRAA